MHRNLFSLKAGLASAILLSTLPVFAADWANWRGPTHDGVSTETGWQATWPAEGPKQLWKKSIGIGFSSLTVSKGRLYASGNSNNVDTIFCFDAESGKEIWSYSYNSPLDAKLYEGGPSATPTVDGDSVYTLSRKGLILCLTADTGKVLWTNNIAETNGDTALGLKAPSWGFASSAYIDGNLAIFNIGKSGVAFDKKTGAVAWKSGTDTSGYSTPRPFSFDGKKAITLMRSKTVIALDPQTGLELWQFPWKTSYDLNVTDPIVSGDKVFVSAGYDHGAALFQIKDGKAEQVWENKKFRNHINSSILLDGFLYGFDGNASDEAKFVCVDFQTGTTKWTQEGLGSGSIILADKTMIILSSKGELLTATPSSEAFKPISRAQVLQGKCWTSPTLANGRIYCRSAKGDLVCLDVKKN
jgi:outer membrane protein assembly factor BamB